jgi:hypothetical protein
MGCPSSLGSTMVRASSGGAPSRPAPRAASPWSPQAPPRLQLRGAVAEIIAQKRRLVEMRQLSLGPKYA